jgi:hypothetical protein
LNCSPRLYAEQIPRFDDWTVMVADHTRDQHGSHRRAHPRGCCRALLLVGLSMDYIASSQCGGIGM